MQLCEQLRKSEKNANIPILMLTVLSGERERVKGLRAGADDYLIKPFSPAELVARIEAILRRSERQGGIPHVVSSSKVSVDLDRHEVKADGKIVELSPKEYDLLVTFLQRPGHVLSSTHLSQTIWDLDKPASRHVINEHIKNLRKKLGRCGELIETVPEAGYRFKES